LFPFLRSGAHQVVPTDLSGFILAEAHRLLLVKAAAWVKVVHGHATLVHDHLPARHVHHSLAPAWVLNRAQLGVARTASFHVRRVNRRVVAMQAACRPVIGLVDRHARLLRAHLRVLRERKRAGVVARPHDLLSIAVAVSWLFVRPRDLIRHHVLNL